MTFVLIKKGQVQTFFDERGYHSIVIIEIFRSSSGPLTIAVKETSHSHAIGVRYRLRWRLVSVNTKQFLFAII